MRTTIILDDELGARLRHQAKQEGKSFSAFLADSGRKALETRPTEPSEPFHLITFRGEGVTPGINLDRTNDLLVAEDECHYGDRSE